MTLRLGFVGVGRWASKLATAFRACGAEVVCHVRSTVCGCTEPQSCPWCTVPGFGTQQKNGWRGMLERPDLDAIVAAATPEVTTQAALACAAAGKPVMATKPIWRHPERVSAPWYIDFFRLWSSGMQEARTMLATFPDHALTIDLHGSGPFRSFPGAFDWGPHVMAAALDLLGPGIADAPLSVEKTERDGGEIYDVQGDINGRKFRLMFGNASLEPRRLMRVGRVPIAVEEGDTIGNQTKQEVLEAMCRAFMADVSEGFASTRLLDLSRESTRMIQRIREMAK